MDGQPDNIIILVTAAAIKIYYKQNGDWNQCGLKGYMFFQVRISTFLGVVVLINYLIQTEISQK